MCALIWFRFQTGEEKNRATMAPAAVGQRRDRHEEAAVWRRKEEGYLLLLSSSSADGFGVGLGVSDCKRSLRASIYDVHRVSGFFDHSPTPLPAKSPLG